MFSHSRLLFETDDLTHSSPATLRSQCYSSFAVEARAMSNSHHSQNTQPRGGLISVEENSSMVGTCRNLGLKFPISSRV